MTTERFDLKLRTGEKLFSEKRTNFDERKKEETNFYTYIFIRNQEMALVLEILVSFLIFSIKSFVKVS